MNSQAVLKSVENESNEMSKIELYDENNLTPPQIVSELDRYVISQDDAKKAVAIALRNRWRRLKVNKDFQEEITPKNILMIGPTGVGKTEISRRLAKLARAPFIKVEASKFTEVGYVGRDVESIIRDLLEISHNLVKEEARLAVQLQAEYLVEEKILDYLLPTQKVEPKEDLSSDGSFHLDVSEILESSSMSKAELEAKIVKKDKSSDIPPAQQNLSEQNSNSQASTNSATGTSGTGTKEESPSSTRAKLRIMLKNGKLEDREIEIEFVKPMAAHLEVFGPSGLAEMEGQIKDMFSSLAPKSKDKRKVKISDARKLLLSDIQESLLDREKIARIAVERAEQAGIVFIDEIDKICGQSSGQGKGPDVSREGVQRDLLPIVEGSTVSTKYGPVKTDHMLFIASGAFHFTKPSDLMPEFQGRFPIRVELKSLTAEHFTKILLEPKNALTKQYQALLAAEEVELEFTNDAIFEIAKLTAEVNSTTEDIGARRLHTLLEKLLEELSFTAHEKRGCKVVIDREYVSSRLSEVVKDVDLARFIL